MIITSANRRGGALYFEPLPKSIHWFAPRKAVSYKTWAIIKKAVREETNYRCCFCGDDYSRTKSKLHTHEVYEFNIDNKTATIIDLIPVCETCHSVIHINNSILRGESIEKLMEWQLLVNEEKDVLEDESEVLNRWKAIGEIELIDCRYFRKYISHLPDRIIQKGESYEISGIGDSANQLLVYGQYNALENTISKKNESLVDDTKYVVLDVETNGLSSECYDLLSISIYKPDEDIMYNRYLPLELNDMIYTTWINGITADKLEGTCELTQSDASNLIDDFDLNNRTVLHYGNIDKRFIKGYFKRKKLVGIDGVKFFNFKHDIIAERFPKIKISKDNLCRFFGIEGVSNIHCGTNDCLLEWQLYKKLDGNKLLIDGHRVFALESDYLVPTALMYRFYNLRYLINKLPRLKVSFTKVFNESKTKSNIQTVKLNILNILESLQPESAYRNYLVKENAKHIKYLGHILPSWVKEYEEKKLIMPEDTLSIGRSNLILPPHSTNKRHSLFIEYIKNEIFKGEKVYADEIIVNREANCVSICDLSNKYSVLSLEINVKKIKDASFQYHLYFQAAGRNCFVIDEQSDIYHVHFQLRE